MDESLRRLYIQGIISQEEALYRAEDKVVMRSNFNS
jgi:Tfp pilus assembly ATPase PilU